MSRRASRSSSRVRKVWTRSRFSDRVRRKRSAQPWPLGARTKPGDDAASSQAVSLEVGRPGLTAVIVAEAEARGGGLEAAEALDDAPTDRLRRLMPGAAQGGMEAPARGRAVVDADKDGALTGLGGAGRGHVGDSTSSPPSPG